MRVLVCLFSFFVLAEGGAVNWDPITPLLNTDEGAIHPFHSDIEQALTRLHLHYMSKHVSENLVLSVFSGDVTFMMDNMVCSIVPLLGNNTSVLLVSLDGDCSSVNTHGLRIECVGHDFKNIKSEDGVVRYNVGAYSSIMAQKLVVASIVFDHARGIGFKKMLNTDADVVFLSNPFDHGKECHANMCFMNGARLGVNQCRYRSSGLINGGFYISQTLPSVSLVFSHAISNFKRGVTYDGGDQGAIQAALGQLKEDSLLWGYLDCREFPNGHVYFTNQKELRNAAAVHVNWIITSQEKIECMRKGGLIFTDGRGLCIPPNLKYASFKVNPNGVITCTEEV